MTRKKLQSGVLHLNTYTILERAIEDGLASGWRHAHKHTDTPSPEDVQEHQRSDIMCALNEVVNFDI